MVSFIKRALDSLILSESSSNSNYPPPLKDEIVFCKNNVCVHPNSPSLKQDSNVDDQIHWPGYLTVKCQDCDVMGLTFILSWIPNSSLKPNKRNNLSSNKSHSDANLSSSSPFLDRSTSHVTSISYSGSSCNSASSQSPVKVSPVISQTDIGGVFNADLGLMRSVRIFYTDENRFSGHLVLASSEAQFKVLHFHHGGLQHFENLLKQIKFMARPIKSRLLRYNPELYEEYHVVRPRFKKNDIHPEECQFSTVTADNWKRFKNTDGQIVETAILKKTIFFGGIDPSIRSEVWPFLLKLFPFDSTLEEREEILLSCKDAYEKINKNRLTMSESESSKFYQNVQCVVEKDVIRTDRNQEFYAGDKNSNLEILKELLLNYAWSHPSCGYFQGMSDLLSPLLMELRDEVLTFYCFEGLIQKIVFISSPTDSDMDQQLGYLRELIAFMSPSFYRHLKSVDPDAMDLLFVHRWILLCFKREFNDSEVLQLWEACWAHYQTDYFHLFLCLSIIHVYGQEVVDRNMPSYDILQYFASLAYCMDGQLVLKKARLLLRDFRMRSSIPCSLSGICNLCGKGMWDSGYMPKIHCVGHPNNRPCHYEN